MSLKIFFKDGKNIKSSAEIMENIYSNKSDLSTHHLKIISLNASFDFSFIPLVM